MSTLFISYALDDQAVALEVCAQLEAQGVHCWIAPRDVAPGAKWDEAILDAIESASAFLLILTRGANESPYVSNEVNEAFEKKKTIFTFRAEEVLPGKSLKFYLGRQHWIDGFPPPLDGKVAQLAAAVIALIGAAEGVGAGVATRAPAAPSRRSKARSWSLLRLPAGRRLVTHAAALVVGVGIGWWAMASPGSGPAVTRFSYTIQEGIFTSGTRQNVAISPDGSRLVVSVHRTAVRTVAVGIGCQAPARDRAAG
ncbi:MAG: hypothetical protein A3F70_00600 [Acidobacteria bacterium RIFCSPLOWO2_12_FULL_67_14]|nr:MAG: hypothetical protein A3H29_12875 [Acidobacteria bacterium RIFCSPLOWO2_02_FULL_67_21]OFW38768.1 MAG: hypothetical protein A3F70_00600 [Acidobacteria bacterium RIFCSPLOWO2_12_FULL_67_14]